MNTGIHVLKRVLLLGVLGWLCGAGIRPAGAETVDASARAAGDPAAVERNIIEAGRANWEAPWVPDLAAGGGRKAIAEERRIDVLILGDGYLEGERAEFERDVRGWYQGFVSLTPWRQLAGAFRVRGYWTPSEERATGEFRSFYQTAGARPGDQTGARVFDAIRKTESNRANRNGRLTHTAVVMLIRDENRRNPSGASRVVRDGGRGLSVSVGFGAYTHHEFGHAFGGLRDEYISGEGRRAQGETPGRLSIHSLPNLSYTSDPGRIPWKHLMPGTDANPDPDSVIGVLWIGGGAEVGVWHSEGRCLMNGTHENWDFSKTRRGVNLRDRVQFCFWCEEILVARVWERTGQLGDAAEGTVLYEIWEREIRPLYHRHFRVPERIAERNARNQANGWQSASIFERPKPPEEALMPIVVEKGEAIAPAASD